MKFSRLVRTVPKIHSPVKPEFFSYFFLGAALTFPYTKLNDEIGIQGSCVKITSNETIKLAFRIEEGRKTKLAFKTITVVDNLGDRQHLTIDEFKEALGSLDLTEDELNNCEVEGEIVYIKDGEVNLGKLEVLGKGELNSEILREVIRDHGPLPKFDPKEAEFKKVKDGVIGEDSLGKALEAFSEKSLKVNPGKLSEMLL